MIRENGMTEFDYKIALIDKIEETLPTLQKWCVGKFTVISRWDGECSRDIAVRINDVAMMPDSVHGNGIQLGMLVAFGDSIIIDSVSVGSSRRYYDTMDNASAAAASANHDREVRDARFKKEQEERKALAANAPAPAPTPRDASAIFN